MGECESVEYFDLLIVLIAYLVIVGRMIIVNIPLALNCNPKDIPLNTI